MGRRQIDQPAFYFNSSDYPLSRRWSDIIDTERKREIRNL